MKTKNKFLIMSGSLLFLVILWFIGIFLPLLPLGEADSYNSTAYLNTTVNITNSAPEVRTVTLENPITLTAYGNKTVSCNATVFDWDLSHQETLYVNATLYLQGFSAADGPDDKNIHYSNASCVNVTSTSENQINFTCTFTVEYYANNGSNWFCNVTAWDMLNASHSNKSNSAEVQALVAIVVPGVLDFGQMVYNNISEDKLANITNGGNRNISINMSGWGAEKYDGKAMNCSYGYIDLSMLRYNLTTSADYSSWTYMYNLSNATRQINSFTVFHRVDDTTEDASRNTTYWKLKIPPGAAGICSGKILFEAIDTGV